MSLLEGCAVVIAVNQGLSALALAWNTVVTWQNAKVRERAVKRINAALIAEAYTGKSPWPETKEVLS